MTPPSLRLAFALALSLAGVFAASGSMAQTAPGAGAAAESRTPPSPDSAPKVVLELFTSQGCASCPPADELLSELAKDPEVLALTLAVDYWDYIGWKDTLAKHGHSVRQRAYAELRGDRMIYTPQIVVDGLVAAKGNSKDSIARALKKAHELGPVLTVPVSLALNGSELLVDLAAMTGGPGTRAPVTADIWICPVSRSQSVAIGRGENAGKTVTYTNVVRGWIRVGPWTGDAQNYRVDLSRIAQEGVDQVVVLVQTGSPGTPGAIIGASRISLN